MIAVTADGHKINITAHIKSPCQIPAIKEYRIEGIGLLEMNPLFEGPSAFEQEEKHFNIFLEAGEAAGGKQVTVLMTDSVNSCGGESTSRSREKADLGCHGIRYILAYPELYRSLLRALMRAGVRGYYELALPMVGHVDEIIRFKQIINQLRSELEEEGIPYRVPLIGSMVEVPSVIPNLDTIVFESGFFIVGKNFLKYLMADDRLPEGEDDFLSFYHQAFLLQAQSLIQSLSKRKANVRICAPLVKDPAAIPVLIGMDFYEIVAPPPLVPEISKIVRSTNYLNARLVSSKTTSFWHPEQAREYAMERLLKLPLK